MKHNMNYCHNPPGPGGGQFCSDKSLGGELKGEKKGSYTPIRRQTTEQKRRQTTEQNKPSIKTLGNKPTIDLVPIHTEHGTYFKFPDIYSKNPEKYKLWVAQITHYDKQHGFIRRFMGMRGDTMFYPMSDFKDGEIYEFAVKDRESNKYKVQLVTEFKDGTFVELDNKTLSSKLSERAPRQRAELENKWYAGVEKRISHNLPKPDQKIVSDIQETMLSKLTDDELKSVYNTFKDMAVGRRAHIVEQWARKGESK